jgi:hypothetical protein
VLDHLIARTVRIDVSAIQANRERESEKQRGNLGVGAHRRVRRYRLRPGELGNRLGDVGERGPGDETGITVTDFLSSAVVMRR